MKLTTISHNISPTVSVIVVTYDQELEKLIRTIDSILIQEKVDLEIIICDDGSERQYEAELKSYFSAKGFDRFKFVFHDRNLGTVLNYYSGLEVAAGQYSKLISPGDRLTGKDTLYRWIQFMKKTKAAWSFSDTYYYRTENREEVPFRAKARPQFIGPYIHSKKVSCRWNYVTLGDKANGASIIGETALQKQYCAVLIDNGIKYGEDYIYQLMMFYGVVGCYYPGVAVSYEDGCGISTSGNALWSSRLAEDRKKLYQIMIDDPDKSELQKKMTEAIIRKRQLGRFARLGIKGRLFFTLKRRLHPRLTPLPEDEGAKDIHEKRCLSRCDGRRQASGYNCGEKRKYV